PDPAALFQPRDGAVQRPGTEAHAGKALDVLHHGVAMFFAIGQAGENKKTRIVHAITSHAVSYDVINPKSSANSHVNDMWLSDNGRPLRSTFRQRCFSARIGNHAPTGDSDEATSFPKGSRMAGGECSESKRDQAAG